MSIFYETSTEGKIEEMLEVTGRRGRRRKQLLDDLTETSGHCKLKQEALERTLWRTGFGSGCGHAVRETKEWMNEWMNEWMEYF